MFRLITCAIFFRSLTLPLFLSLCLFLSTAEALTSEGQQVEFNIAKLPLKDALNQLLKQAKIQLLYESSLVENLNSPTLTGFYAVEVALALLLEGTDLRFKRINRNMYIIFRNSVTDQSSMVDEFSHHTAGDKKKKFPVEKLLPEVVVVGETHRTISIQEPSTATKIFVPTMKVPRSVEGIDANLFRDRGNATLAEAFRDYSSINITDQSGLINLRGFRIHDQSILKAGLPSISRGITPLPLQNIEGIEVAKGANSALYGYGQPGGVINLIPKKPQAQPFTNLSVSYGNYDHYLALDSNNPLKLDDRFTERFNFLFREEREHNQIDGSIQQIQVTPALIYQVDEDKILSFNIEYNHQEIDGLGGKRVFDKALPEWQPALDFLFPNLVEVPYYPYSGSDAADLQKSDSFDVWTRLKAPINNNWDYTLAAYAGRSDIDIRSNIDLSIWFTPFIGSSNVNTLDLLYKVPNRDTYQSNFEEAKKKFSEQFYATYGDFIDEDIGIMQAIYGDNTTPSWSDNKMRIYQQLDDIYQEAEQAGFESNAHGIVDFAGATHDLVFGVFYLQRQWQYEALAYYSSELYNRGTALISQGDLVTGFALRRHSKYGWFYPYGPAVDDLDLVLPDQIATKANLPVSAHYPVDSKQKYYDAKESTKSLGVYLQDHISIDDDWCLLLAAGFNRYQRNFYNSIANGPSLLTGDNWFLEELNLSYFENSFSPQVGVVYLPSDDISLYASSGKQFDIVNGLQISGDPATPEKTTNNEFGIKWWPLEELNVSSSVFQINKENYAIPGDTKTGFANIQQNGTLQSTGAELNITGFVIPHIKIATNYSHINPTSEVDSGVSDGLLRALLNGVPKKNGSFWLQYYTHPFGERSWSIGAGVNYVGQRQYELQQITSVLESYTLIDMRIDYKNDDFRIALNIDNLTNRQWLSGASTKSIGVPEIAYLTTQVSAFHVALGYGTRVRLTTELYF